MRFCEATKASSTPSGVRPTRCYTTASRTCSSAPSVGRRRKFVGITRNSAIGPIDGRSPAGTGRQGGVPLRGTVSSTSALIGFTAQEFGRILPDHPPFCADCTQNVQTGGRCGRHRSDPFACRWPRELVQTAWFSSYADAAKLLSHTPLENDIISPRRRCPDQQNLLYFTSHQRP